MSAAVTVKSTVSPVAAVQMAGLTSEQVVLFTARLAMLTVGAVVSNASTVTRALFCTVVAPCVYLPVSV